MLVAKCPVTTASARDHQTERQPGWHREDQSELHRVSFLGIAVNSRLSAVVRPPAFGKNCSELAPAVTLET